MSTLYQSRPSECRLDPVTRRPATWRDVSGGHWCMDHAVLRNRDSSAAAPKSRGGTLPARLRSDNGLVFPGGPERWTRRSRKWRLAWAATACSDSKPSAQSGEPWPPRVSQCPPLAGETWAVPGCETPCGAEHHGPDGTQAGSDRTEEITCSWPLRVQEFGQPNHSR